jgi:cell division topological specificity factor
MISELLERLFPRSGPDSSRLEVKRRLKLVLAYDRADITPDTFEAMRQEILEVVSRYVELDSEGFNLSLENSDRATALIANFPIRRMKTQVESSAKSTSGMSLDLPSNSSQFTADGDLISLLSAPEIESEIDLENDLDIDSESEIDAELETASKSTPELKLQLGLEANPNINLEPKQLEKKPDSDQD